MIINSNIVVTVNDKVLSPEEYTLEDNSLTFKSPPEIGDEIKIKRLKDNGQTDN
jgi:hypothetical protein